MPQGKADDISPVGTWTRIYVLLSGGLIVGYHGEWRAFFGAWRERVYNQIHHKFTLKQIRRILPMLEGRGVIAKAGTRQTEDWRYQKQEIPTYAIIENAHHA